VVDDGLGIRTRPRDAERRRTRRSECFRTMIYLENTEQWRTVREILEGEIGVWGSQPISGPKVAKSTPSYFVPSGTLYPSHKTPSTDQEQFPISFVLKSFHHCVPPDTLAFSCRFPFWISRPHREILRLGWPIPNDPVAFSLSA
jgi:hypothetical protein